MKKIILPIIFICLTANLAAQFSREQAIELVITEIVGINNLQYNHLYSKYESLVEQDTLWLDSYFDFLLPSFDENWVFFIDLMPVVHWAHPCQYVFVSAESEEYEIFDHNWPPHPFLDNYQVFQEQWEWVLSIGSGDIEAAGHVCHIHPNPVSGLFYVNVPGSTGKKVRLLIRDLKGNTNYENTLQNNHAPHLPIRTDALSEGLHLIVIEVDDIEVIYEKLLIAK